MTTGRLFNSFYCWFSIRAQMNPWLRTVAHRYGRSYWQLPATLRRRICWEPDVPALAGVEKFPVGEAESIPPISDQQDSTPRPHAVSHRLVSKGSRVPTPFVARVPRAWLVGHYASPVTSQGRLTLGAFRDAPSLLGSERHLDLEAWIKASHWKSASSLPPLQHVWSMVNRLQTNFFHWIVDWCGRLEWLEIYRRKTGRAPSLLIPQLGPDYVRASLGLLGYGEELLHEWPADSPPRPVTDLLVPSLRGTANTTSPSAMRWLRERFLAATDSTQNVANRKIYLPRRPGTWRAVLNSQEVESCLQDQGFEVFEPQLFPLREQIRAFSEARLIVGLHGAGLTNILFAPGATLLELFGDYGDGLYHSMTARLGQRYESMDCQRDGQDVIVDLDVLNQRLKAVAA